MDNTANKIESASTAGKPSTFNLQPSTWLLALLLALATVALYWPATQNDFVNYDDDVYVTANPHVQGGLTMENIKWAFSSQVCANWHPVTMLSLMLDDQLFGQKPWGYHLTNILLHALNTALLFLLLRALTASLSHRMGNGFALTRPAATLSHRMGEGWGEGMWRCAFVAALFAVHPLRVESVAWVAERKDVLSAFFGLLALIFYVRYAQTWSKVEGRGSSASLVSSALDTRHSTLDYSLALLFFALGLMSKPMLVTLPCVLLLLDYWPLERWPRGEGRVTSGGISGSAFDSRLSTLGRLLLEKLPFLALAIASCVITLVAQRSAAAPVQDLSIPWRIEDAVVAYVDYLKQMIYPTGLAVFYPLPGTPPPLWQFGLSLLVLLAISLGAMAGRRKHPWLLVGWLWYLGMLVPVIGLVQVGSQARADRYTYLPAIGLCLLVTWGVAELCGAWRHRRQLLGALAVAVIGGLLATTYVQTGYWKDGVTLWTHALTCTSGNWLAHENLATALFRQKKVAEAVEQYEQSILLNPKIASSQCDFGIALAAEGRTTEAMEHYQLALQINPDYADAYVDIGTILANQGNLDEAIKHFERAVQIKPDHAKAHYDLGSALLSQGNWTGAVDHYQRALQINPDYTLACLGLGNALASHGQFNKAIPYFQRAATLAAAQGNSGLAQAIRSQLNSIPPPSSPPQSP